MNVVGAYTAAKDSPRFAPVTNIIKAVLEIFAVTPVSASGLQIAKFLRSTEAYEGAHGLLLLANGIGEQTSGEICSETTRMVVVRLKDKYVSERMSVLRKILVDEWEKLGKEAKAEFPKLFADFEIMQNVSVGQVHGLLLCLLKQEVSVDPF